VAKLVEGADVALVSDAGTPGIVDPGYHLVRGAVAAGIRVVPIPGPSAAAAIVSVAGLPVERFVFEGFLPSRSGPRRERLRRLAREARAIVFLEAPTRLGASLADMEETLGDREAVLGRELTKLHEECLRGSLSTLRAAVAAMPRVRGECVLLVGGVAEDSFVPTAVDPDARIRALAAEGLGTREIAARVAHETVLSRREAYQRALALRAGG
jgi:16S rRNA (cytidine1402-2'-O)-methyltransferase